MPRPKNVPSKIKAVTYLTHVEHTQATVFAKAKQLTLSEWIRMLVLNAFANPTSGLHVAPPQPISQPLPTARELMKDFQFGDVNELTDDEKREI